MNEKGGAVGVFGNSSSFASSVLDDSTYNHEEIMCLKHRCGLVLF